MLHRKNNQFGLDFQSEFNVFRGECEEKAIELQRR